MTSVMDTQLFDLVDDDRRRSSTTSVRVDGLRLAVMLLVTLVLGCGVEPPPPVPQADPPAALAPVLEPALPEPKPAPKPKPVAAVEPVPVTSCAIVVEGLARFGRSECAVLKERFMHCWEHCGQDMPLVRRFVSTSTSIGVLLFAIPPHWESRTALGLYRLTELHKYDMQLRQCIGISFARHGDERFIGWIYLDSAWEPDPELATEVANAPRELLPPLRAAHLPPYRFRE